MDSRPAPMTLSEWVRWTHPDHAQRIVEEVWRQDPKNAAAVLAGPPGAYPIAHAFHWRSTQEGHDYWQKLSGEPFGKKNKPTREQVREKAKRKGKKRVGAIMTSWRGIK